jgi:signal peptidase II
VKKRRAYFIFIFLLLVVDQVTKTLIDRSVALFSSKTILPGFFNLVHVRNRGAIFGFLAHMDNSLIYILLTLASLTALVLVVYYFFKTPATEKLLLAALSLILAGALGNLVDRVFRGYVIDFLDFYVKNWHWPSFNVADSCISVGAFVLISVLIFRRTPNVPHTD